MTPLDKLSELEKACDLATPGPWKNNPGNPMIHGPKGAGEVAKIREVFMDRTQRDNNAAFISAANPATIKTLIQVIRDAREALAFYANREMYMADCELGDITEWELDCYGDKARKAEAKIDALLEGIK